MSAKPSNDDRLDDMAGKLYSLYDDEGESAEEFVGAIYSELRSFGDRYVDARVLARGGMKKISRVFDTKTGRQVAMAELRANAPLELYEPFLREARLTSLLEHPNIISVHDTGLLPDGRPFFTMDLKRGDSLADILRKSKMPHEQLLEIYIKLCDAISYAHSQKVLHLDLKPENIQVGRFGEVFICDWGLGKIIGSDESEGIEFDEILFNPDLLNNMTLSGELKGTPGYMAPEQFEKGGIKTCGTDVYALGCLLYAILTQKPPFAGTAEEIRKQTLAGKIVSPMSAFPNKSIPKGLNAVTMKALALSPSDRYASVAELRDDVKNYLSGFATTAENAGFLKEASLFYKRNRPACLVGVAAMGVVVLTTSLFIVKLQNNIVEINRSNERTTAQRHKAEEASRRYRDELVRYTRLLGSLSGDLKVESQELARSLIYSDPVLALELSMQRLKFLLSDEDEANVSSQIGYTYFIMQDFASANEYFDPQNPVFEDLMPISRKYEVLKTGTLLTIGQLVELINELAAHRKDRKPLLEKILVYDHATREGLLEYDQVVGAVLRGWNKEWTDGRFEYDPRGGHLKMTGEHLVKFALISENTSGESPIRFLDVNHLEVQGTGLKDLNEIKTLPIQSLDMRDTAVDDLSPIGLFSSLETLVVSKNRFSRRQLAELPQTLKVVER
ncbi:Serine/threonine-protein kinase PknD [Pontiella desulfatans]|uniref:Serine/threonine-protein kinase PknD n=1 Tax=Pontiella desulfatans TaxID=2750659 RepID=A0A6C2U806_PONDE|nr:serine/threonine-protein kinase [Pontiella desulfatans]VGO15651.1 Serine/threonine-protein kinase PknD [Pontiella desulfatans]